MLPNRHDEGGYVPGQIIPIPTRPWQPPHTPACYMPNKNDSSSYQELDMGTTGPWASGHVDWTPLSGMTGTRPVVDKYSITRYSTGEWRHHNAQTLEGEPIREADRLDIESKNCLLRTYAVADKDFSDNTELLKCRAQDIYRWKSELEFAIKAMSEEIIILEEHRQRLKAALAVLLLPESIAGECLDLRSNRLEPDLVRDSAEVELIKELSLIAQIRYLFTNKLVEVETQMVNNKAAKAKLEFDWSDKIVSYDTESLNIGLSNKSNTVMMKPASVRIPEGQSTMGYWENFCKENLQNAEATRQYSMYLRGLLVAMLLNTARDIRTQADRVDQCLAEKASCTDELRIRLEDELTRTLQKLTEVENLCDELKMALRKMDLSMKVVQTRLDNRCILGRPNVEHCRDPPQLGLIQEVRTISDCMSSLRDKLHHANDVRSKLLKSRSDLEKDIIVKKKSLNIDRDRCAAVRSFYPSATKLSGHD